MFSLNREFLKVWWRKIKLHPSTFVLMMMRHKDKQWWIYCLVKSNFDVKHLVKRCWTNIIKGTVKIQGAKLLKADIKKLLQLLTIDYHDVVIYEALCFDVEQGWMNGIHNDSNDVENIIYPKDKQNVPAATACLLKFVDAITTDKLNLISYKLYQIKKNKLKLLAAVYEGHLCLYSKSFIFTVILI